MANKWANIIEDAPESEPNLEGDRVSSLTRTQSTSSDVSDSGRRKVVNIATVDIHRKSQIQETEKDKDYRRQFFYSIIQSSKEDGDEPEKISEQSLTNGGHEPPPEDGQEANVDDDSSENIKVEEGQDGEMELKDSSNSEETTDVDQKAIEDDGREQINAVSPKCGVDSEGNIENESEKEAETQDDAANKDNSSANQSLNEVELPEHDKETQQSDNEKLDDHSKNNSESAANENEESEGRAVGLDSTQDESNTSKESNLTEQHRTDNDSERVEDLVKETVDNDSEVTADELVEKSSEKEATTTLTETETSEGQSDEPSEPLQDDKETKVEETGNTSVVNEPSSNSTEEQQTRNNIPQNIEIPQETPMSEVSKAHSIDISKVTTVSDNQDRQEDGASEPTSPTTPTSPHEARPLIPEFLWSPMHQRLLADILFAIESDLQVWRR